jgi:anti-sigma factor RsiW
MSILSSDLTCQKAVELVTDYLEGKLSWRQRRRFEKHIGACPNCTAYLDQIRTTIELAGHVEPERLDAQVRDDLIELYRRVKGNDQT